MTGFCMEQNNTTKRVKKPETILTLIKLFHYGLGKTKSKQSKTKSALHLEPSRAFKMGLFVKIINEIS